MPDFYTEMLMHFFYTTSLAGLIVHTSHIDGVQVPKGKGHWAVLEGFLPTEKHWNSAAQNTAKGFNSPQLPQ